MNKGIQQVCAYRGVRVVSLLPLVTGIRLPHAAKPAALVVDARDMVWAWHSQFAASLLPTRAYRRRTTGRTAGWKATRTEATAECALSARGPTTRGDRLELPQWSGTELLQVHSPGSLGLPCQHSGAHGGLKGHTDGSHG